MEDYDEYEYYPPKGTCSACGMACIGIETDEGIGPYEYWGQKGNDVQIVILSDCCDADLIE